MAKLILKLILLFVIIFITLNLLCKSVSLPLKLMQAINDSRGTLENPKPLLTRDTLAMVTLIIPSKF